MHQNAQEAIENKIRGSLVNCNIKDNWPEYESISKHVSSLSKETLKQKKGWLDETDIFSIFYDFVFETISVKVEGEQKYEGNLWDILGKEEGEQLVQKIKEYLISIPRNFSVYIPLPQISQSLPGNIKLSKNLSFEVFEESDKVPGGYRGGLLGVLGKKFELNRVYLRQDLSGYCGNSIESTSNKKAVSNFKILLQQGIFRKLFKINPETKVGFGLLRGFSHHQVPKTNIISIDNNRTPAKTLNIELPLDFSKWANNIDLNWDNPQISKSLEDGKIGNLINNYLKKPIELIECNEQEAIRVKSAIQWCFDSFISENQTLAFLQTCIGLEALLGDDGYKGSLTKILADRCSYLIGNDIKGRKTIKKRFEELYEVRSKLVHGNARELDRSEMFFLNWGRTILQYAIVKEIKHLNLEKNITNKVRLGALYGTY